MAEKESRRRRQFTEEFKRDAVDLVRTSGRPIAPRSPVSWGSMTPRWATGSVRTASTVASARG